MMLSFRVGTVGVQKLAIRGKKLSDMSDMAGGGGCVCITKVFTSRVEVIFKTGWSSF